MDLINESERRFTKKLCDTMTPVMIETFWEIWLEAQKEAKGKNTIQVFQQLLRDVKTWNSSISHKNAEAIVKSNSMFPKLLAAVFVIHVKILSSIRTDKKSKKISIKLPANDVFVQECYIRSAKDLYEDPDIITGKHTDEERKKNLSARFCEHIKEAIEYLIPMAEILDTYLTLPDEGEGMGFEEEEEVPEMDAPIEEPAPDPVEGLPENTPNMEFGHTPGGSQTVTTTNSLTPPSVPGGTPAPTSDNLFDDAPDDQNVKKIP